VPGRLTADFNTLSTVSDVFTLPQEVGGLGYPRPLGIMAQELCHHLQRSIKHDDVAKQIEQWDLDQTLEKWACASLHDLQQEMALWTGSGLGDKMGESSQVHATFVHGGGLEPRGETTRRDRRYELGASYPRTSQASTQNRSHGWRQVFVGGWSMEHAERTVETCLGWRKSLLGCGSETRSGGRTWLKAHAKEAPRCGKYHY
jgi:hypothetical protein